MTIEREQGSVADPALVEALADWRTKDRLSNEAVRAIRVRRRVVRSTAGGIAAVLIAVGVFHHRTPDTTQIAHLGTIRGETRSVRLSDGSTLRLDGGTRLTIRYRQDDRLVTLMHGAAFFDVAHDPTRPFIVTAGDGDVRVLGTAFDVDRTAGRMAVAVYRGAVRLAGRDDPRGEWVPAGWRGHVIHGHAAPAARFDALPDDRRLGWLDVDGLRLDDLVTMLNRRSGPIILPPPASLANIPISGRFRTDDPQSLLESLGISYGFHVAKKDNALTLSPK